MSSTVSPTTAEQLAAMPDDGHRYDLVNGELRVMSPAGSEHGRIAMRLAWRVAEFVETNRLGATYTAETGFLIQRDPDTVRAPDFAFITQRRLDALGAQSGYWPGAPDLVAEVVSPGDGFSDVEQKSLQWLECGTSLVWVVDPQQQHVTVYRGPSDITVLAGDALLEAPTLLPEWKLRVDELFAH